ncbi:MAG: hypothetical protein AAGA18_06290 [Verrucomicrobiota bacterium]
MKKKLTLLALALIPTACLLGKTISLDGGSVAFDAPDEFTPVPQEIIDIKYPSSRAPKYVIGNKSAATTIAYDIKPHSIPQHKIEEARKSFRDLFPRIIPGLQWKENKVITLAGQKWGYMEMTSTAIDTNIYNIMLFTGYKGKMLVFNFNSIREEFPKYEKALRDSLNSIEIK